MAYTSQALNECFIQVIIYFYDFGYQPLRAAVKFHLGLNESDLPTRYSCPSVLDYRLYCLSDQPFRA